MMARRELELSLLLLCLVLLLLVTPGQVGTPATAAPVLGDTNPVWTHQRYLFNAPEPICPYRTVLEDKVAAGSAVSQEAALQLAHQHAAEQCQAQCTAHGASCAFSRMGSRSKQLEQRGNLFRVQIEIGWCECDQAR